MVVRQKASSLRSSRQGVSETDSSYFERNLPGISSTTLFLLNSLYSKSRPGNGKRRRNFLNQLFILNSAPASLKLGTATPGSTFWMMLAPAAVRRLNALEAHDDFTFCMNVDTNPELLPLWRENRLVRG